VPTFSRDIERQFMIKERLGWRIVYVLELRF
jgi:hypothetical protein